MHFNVLFPPFQIVNRFSFFLSQTCLTMTKFMESNQSILTSTISSKCTIKICSHVSWLVFPWEQWWSWLARFLVWLAFRFSLLVRVARGKSEGKENQRSKWIIFFPVKRESGCRILEERNWHLLCSKRSFSLPFLHFSIPVSSFEFLQSKRGLNFGRS